MKNILKRSLFAFAAIVASGLLNVSCESIDSDSRSRGIMAPQGQSREQIYDMQDRAVRQLAY